MIKLKSRSTQALLYDKCLQIARHMFAILGIVSESRYVKVSSLFINESYCRCCHYLVEPVKLYTDPHKQFAVSWQPYSTMFWILWCDGCSTMSKCNSCFFLCHCPQDLQDRKERRGMTEPLVQWGHLGWADWEVCTSPPPPPPLPTLTLLSFHLMCAVCLSIPWMTWTFASKYHKSLFSFIRLPSPEHVFICSNDGFLTGSQ